jgi:hypothetical protein
MHLKAAGGGAFFAFIAVEDQNAQAEFLPLGRI